MRVVEAYRHRTLPWMIADGSKAFFRIGQEGSPGELIGSRPYTDTTEKFRFCRLADDTKCTRNDIKQFSADLLTLM